MKIIFGIVGVFVFFYLACLLIFDESQLKLDNPFDDMKFSKKAWTASAPKYAPMCMDLINNQLKKGDDIQEVIQKTGMIGPVTDYDYADYEEIYSNVDKDKKAESFICFYAGKKLNRNIQFGYVTLCFDGKKKFVGGKIKVMHK